MLLSLYCLLGRGYSLGFRSCLLVFIWYLHCQNHFNYWNIVVDGMYVLHDWCLLIGEWLEWVRVPMVIARCCRVRLDPTWEVYGMSCAGYGCSRCSPSSACAEWAKSQIFCSGVTSIVDGDISTTWIGLFKFFREWLCGWEFIQLWEVGVADLTLGSQRGSLVDKGHGCPSLVATWLMICWFSWFWILKLK